MTEHTEGNQDDPGIDETRGYVKQLTKYEPGTTHSLLVIAIIGEYSEELTISGGQRRNRLGFRLGKA
jgi:hypothetical protein